MPIVQLVVLGYAFGGNVKHLKVGVVDQDARRPRGQAARARRRGRRQRATFDDNRRTHDPGSGVTDLRNGRLNGVLTIPPDFSRRVLAKDDPHVALIEDNTDNFVSATLAASDAPACVEAYNQPAGHGRSRRRRTRRSTSSRSIRTCRTSSTCCPARS